MDCRISLAVGLLLGVGGGFSAVAAPLNLLDAAPALAAPLPAAAIAQMPENQGYNIIHVNPRAGNDVQGIGSQMQPLKTITYALQIAQPNTLILLANGVYSEQSGEVFPLQMRSGVTLQGSGGPNAAQVLIQGGANYISPTQGLQNVTLLSAHNAGLANVTVSNPHPSGIGLWIETGSPIILENAFFRNGSTGVYIAGSGSPVIRNNYFAENRDAGLVIAGPSSAQVQGNVFENTGTGISIAPGATPEITNNQVMHNQEGLVIHADARPILRQNQIQQNRHNSILDYGAWTETAVALGDPPTQPLPSNVATIAESGGTLTTRPPVTAQPSEAMIPPVEVAAAPSSATTGTSASSPAPASQPSVQPLTALGNDLSALATPTPVLTAAAPTTPPTPVNAVLKTDLRPLLALADTAAVQQLTTATAPTVETDSPSPTASTTSVAVFNPRNASRPEDATVSLIAPPAQPDRDRAAATVGAPQPNNAIATPPDAIEIPVIPPPLATPSLSAADPTPAADTTVAIATPAAQPDFSDLPALPPFADDTSSADRARLVVPSFDIPMGSGMDIPNLFPLNDALAGPPPPPSLASFAGLPYRVLVSLENGNTAATLRQQVPDAFMVSLNGATLMQAGAYATFEEAQTLARQLNRQGLRVQVEHLP